jgi:sugar phosphate isomerase/epimerase
MKLAFSTNAYTRHSLSDALAGVRRAGFEGVEILADTPHAYPDMLNEASIRAIRQELKGLGLAVSNVNANCSFGYWQHAPAEPYFEPSLISPDPNHRADRANLIRKTLHFAHEVGSANISITSGRMLAGMPPVRAAQVFAESIKPLLEEADRLGVNIGIECEPGLFLEYAVELREWIDRLGHPRLGANLDVGHSQVLGESIPDSVRLLAGRIWNLHVEDIPGRKHYHLVPGEGTLDWAGLIAALRSAQYDRFLTVELYTHTANPQDAAQRSYTFLRDLLAASAQ